MKLPNRTDIAKEGKALSGHRPMKGSLTILLCGNANRDLKIKLLFVYYPENPRVFKKNCVMKSKLGVI